MGTNEGDKNKDLETIQDTTSFTSEPTAPNNPKQKPQNSKTQAKTFLAQRENAICFFLYSLSALL